MSEISGEIEFKRDNKTIIIMNYKIEDEKVYQFLKEIDEEKRHDILETVIKIGILGLKRMVMGEEIDYVEKEFTEFANTVNKMFDPSIETSHLGQLKKLIGDYFDEGGTIESMFDPSIETSHLGKLKKLIKDYFDEGGAIERMLDPMVENTPLGKLRTEIRNEIQGLRDIISEKKGAEELIDSTTLKGMKFEDACESILEQLVPTQFGDQLDRTAQERGEEDDRFVGDFVITLKSNPNKKIVIETKDWQNLTQPQILNNMKDAIRNRGAQYGIFVSKYKEAYPQKIGWFNEYEGNILVCALGCRETDTFFPELLNVAYQWAKIRLEKDIFMGEDALASVKETRDAVMVSINKLELMLNKFAQMKKQCTNIETASEKIRNLSDEIKNEISEQIELIKKAMKDLEEI